MSAQIYLSILSVVISVTALISAFVSYYTMKKEYTKKIKLDITVEQMLLSEEKISEFLRKNELKPGESIQTIAKALNVVEGGVENALSGRARLSEPDADGKMVVVFKNGLSKEERLFDFAHECGHRINLDPTPATRPEGYNKSEVEQLADYVGAALLMPLDSVYNYLTEKDYKNCSRRKRMALIRDLCAKYGVSEMIALRRVKEVYVIKQSKLSK